MQEKQKQALHTLQFSIDTQVAALSSKRDASSKIVYHAFLEVKEVFNATMPPLDKLKIVREKILEVDKRLARDARYSQFFNWQAFCRIAAATLVVIGLPLAFGYSQREYGTVKFWSDAALAVGKVKKTLKEIDKNNENSQLRPFNNPNSRRPR